MGKLKAFILLGIYILFVVYIVGRGSDNAIANSIAEFLVSIVKSYKKLKPSQYLPKGMNNLNYQRKYLR